MPSRILLLLFSLAFLSMQAWAGPVTNGNFDATSGVTSWNTRNGSRVTLSNCSSPSGTSVTCNSTVGLVAGMRITDPALTINPANGTLVVALPISNNSFAVSGGTITSCPASLLASYAVTPPVLSVTISTTTADSAPNSLRVDGRDSPTDGVIQGATGVVNGGRYTTRFSIRLDAPAQVRCLFLPPGTAQPIILADKVVDQTDVGKWLRVEGTNTLSWSNALSGGQIFFAVEQVYGLGEAAPTGAFPAYNLDTIEMELDTDGDGYWDSEETPTGTNTDPLRADTDGDTMPDKWEILHHLNPNDKLDADLDHDFDGHTAKVEYWANTDPDDAASFPGQTSDLQASPATRALLYYLQTRGARPAGRYLDGHHAQDIANGDYINYVVELNTLMTAAGHPSWVSILSIAAEGPSAAQPLQIATSGPLLRDYMDAGGLGVIHWTPRNPWTNGHQGDKTGVDIADLLTLGTPANLQMTGWMDTVAAEIAALGPDRPVIFRPFSEQNGGWNWYGRISRDDFIALYRWFRDYFVNTKGLHNIIWTIEEHIGAHRAAGVANTGVSMDYYYPGDDVIDLIGFSCYISGWNPGYDADAMSRLHPKAFAITEGGPPPNEDDVPNAYNSLYLDALDAWYPRAAFFVIWNSWITGPNVAIKDNPGYIALLTDERVTNRETLRWHAPVTLTASAASSSSFLLAWDATVGAGSYLVESSTNGEAPWLVASSGPNNSSVPGGYAPSATRHFRVRALYADGDSAPLALASATTWSDFQQWKQNHLGSIAADALGDDDADGLVNLLEYGFDTDPLIVSALPIQDTVSIAGALHLTLTFRRRAGTAEINYIVETTDDLVNGPWLSDATQYGASIDNGDGTETVTYRDTVPLDLAGARFMRVRIDTL